MDKGDSRFYLPIKSKSQCCGTSQQKGLVPRLESKPETGWKEWHQVTIMRKPEES